MTVLLLVSGVVLLATVAYDAISTTLSVGAAAGPLTSRLARGWWGFARRHATRPDSRIIVSAGPVVLLLTIGVWLGLLWAGWTLVFTADPDAVISSATREPASAWSRVYFAGFTACTLGVGDYIPNGQPWEILTAVAVVSGLGLTTLSITYLMPVVGAVTARRVQADTIAGMGGTPQEIVLSGPLDDRFPYLAHRLQALSDSMMGTAERHLSYPVLDYFHSRERHVDLRTQTDLLDEALTLTLLQHGVVAGIPTVDDDTFELGVWPVTARHTSVTTTATATTRTCRADVPAVRSDDPHRDGGDVRGGVLRLVGVEPRAMESELAPVGSRLSASGVRRTPGLGRAGSRFRRSPP